MVGAVTSKPTTGIKFDNVTVGGNITDKHTGSNSRVGGLIAEVGAKDNSASVVPNKVSITNVNINALTINSSGKSNSGGFLGHNWYRVEIDLNSLNVNDSRLTVNNGTELGGLVLSTTGYWSIKEVSFDGVTVKATKCINFGMLASTLLAEIMTLMALTILKVKMSIITEAHEMQLILNLLNLMDIRSHKILR